MAFDQIQLFGVKVTDKGVEAKVSTAGKEYAQLTVMWSSSRKDKADQSEYGPTKFVTVRVFGFEARDAVAAIKPGDRVNVIGSIDHFEWQSQNGPKDDWSVRGSVFPTLPRAERQQQGYQQQAPQQQGYQQQAPQQQGYQQQAPQQDAWNSAPQGGFTNSDDEPPF